MSRKAISAGVQAAWISPIGADKNIVLGNSLTAPSPGAMSHAIRLVGIQSYTNPVPEGDNVAVPGDDGIIGTIPFPSDAAREFILSIAESDLDTDALLQGTAVLSDNNLEMGIGDPDNPVYPDICLITNSKSRDMGNNTKAWRSYIYPNLSLQPLDREGFSNREPAVIRYKATVQSAANTPWGLTIAESNFGTTKGTFIIVKGNFPLAIARYTGDGSTTDFVLDKTPSEDENDSVAYTNSVKVASSAYTLTASTKTLSFTSAPADGLPGVLLYGYTD